MHDDDLGGHDDGEEEDIDYEDQDEDDHYTDGHELIDSIQHTSGQVDASNEHIPLD